MKTESLTNPTNNQAADVYAFTRNLQLRKFTERV